MLSINSCLVVSFASLVPLAICRNNKRRGGTTSMPQWKSRAIQPTQHQGFSVKLHGVKGPELLFDNGSSVAITHNLGTYKLRWRLTNCTGRRYHFRVCTSKSLQHPADLWCPFCNYSEQQWEQAGKRLLPACEQRFMQFLRARNIDAWFACQVVPEFWQAPLDFYNMQQGYFVQVDGRCHWVGMHQTISSVVIQRDMLQAQAAFVAGVTVVRVHMHDTNNYDVLAASLQAATQGFNIVLTPAYASTWVCWNGLQLLYMQVLLLFLPNCRYNTDSYGNIRIYRCNTPT